MFIRFVSMLSLPCYGKTDSDLQSVETCFANLGKLSSEVQTVSCSDAAVSYFHCRPTALFFFSISVVNFYFEEGSRKRNVGTIWIKIGIRVWNSGKGLTHLLVLVQRSVTHANQIESRFSVLSGVSEYMHLGKGVASLLPEFAWNNGMS